MIKQVRQEKVKSAEELKAYKKTLAKKLKISKIYEDITPEYLEKLKEEVDRMVLEESEK